MNERPNVELQVLVNGKKKPRSVRVLSMNCKALFTPCSSVSEILGRDMWSSEVYSPCARGSGDNLHTAGCIMTFL